MYSSSVRGWSARRLRTSSLSERRITGEESGGLGTSLHIPERDGVFNGLLLLEMMAVKKKSLHDMCEELDEEFGPHRYRRQDVRVTEAQKKTIMAAAAKKPLKIGRYSVLNIQTQDGFKFNVEGGWLLIRASGTEPLIRVMVEGRNDRQVKVLAERIATVVAAAAAK